MDAHPVVDAGGPIPAEEPRSDDATFAQVSAPKGMMRLELLGMLVCPWYYLRSRREARALRRRDPTT